MSTDRLLRYLRHVARVRFKWQMPEFMEVEDLVHAGWLGYQDAIQRPTCKKPLGWAVWAMHREMLVWYGGRAGWCSLGAARRLPAPTPEPSVDATAAMAILDALLPPRQREAIHLHVLDDIPLIHVAAHMGTDPATAYSTVRRGLARLRAGLNGTPMQRGGTTFQPEK